MRKFTLFTEPCSAPEVNSWKTNWIQCLLSVPRQKLLFQTDPGLEGGASGSNTESPNFETYFTHKRLSFLRGIQDQLPPPPIPSGSPPVNVPVLKKTCRETFRGGRCVPTGNLCCTLVTPGAELNDSPKARARSARNCGSHSLPQFPLRSHVLVLAHLMLYESKEPLQQYTSISIHGTCVQKEHVINNAFHV